MSACPAPRTRGNRLNFASVRARKLALQVLAHSLCSGAARRGLLVVPPAAGAMPRLLRDVVAAEVAERRGVQDDDDDDNAQARVRVCLDRVMISPVFDLDGLWEALGELDATTTTATRADSDAVAAAAAYTPSSASSSLSSVLEIGDSQDDVDADEGRTGPPPASQDPPRQKLPDIIVVTHFSSLLTSLFTHRDRAAAHAALQLLSSHLRCLSRTLASSPLILLLNSTSSSSFSSSNALAKAAYDATKLPQQQQDPTLRSIFNPPPLCIPGYSSGSRRNKPTFGLVFTQFLDIHLLCTRIPRSCADAEALYAASATTSSSLVLPPKPPRFVTVVEVLLDEVGVWQGRTGERQSREQRWAAVDTAGCRIRDAFGVEDGSRRPRQHEQVGTGHGCPRV